LEVGSNDSEEQKNGEAGILGFFKKTFSSVKKTFESTFNQQRPPKQGRGAIRPKSRVIEDGSRRPSLLFDD